MTPGRTVSVLLLPSPVVGWRGGRPVCVDVVMLVFRRRPVAVAARRIPTHQPEILHEYHLEPRDEQQGHARRRQDRTEPGQPGVYRG